ncbi:MAG TPA: hypothetical protein VJ872_14395, partial [Nocardioides sp.]|nr:hypothetical protein [Nocardioides sp.]
MTTEAETAVAAPDLTDASEAVEQPLEETESGPAYVPDPALVDSIAAVSNRFLDRELSWLRFNERVLELAEDE